MENGELSGTISCCLLQRIVHKAPISYAILLAFVLCSCTNTFPELANTGEPADVVALLPKPTDAGEPTGEVALLPEPTDAGEPTGEVALLPEQASAEEATSAAPVSIAFMGERIFAPSSYPGVPALYSPVLNDFYLYCALSQRYSVLNYDGKVTPDIMREYEGVRWGIALRGHIPNTVSGSENAGYALLDLDGDNSPELLLLGDSSLYSSYVQTPAICSIYAIRDGRLSCIDNGSFELYYATILAADGTLYQCVEDWRGAGYTDLIAFRLEAGMSEFTIVSEARAALSFSGGDVPVPYWVKTGNGEEISITEAEFDSLSEQYKNPKEPMALEFVPMHPGWVNPWTVPRPNEGFSITPVECPQSYRGAPIEYKPQLDDLYLLSERIRRGDKIGAVFHDDWVGETGFAEIPSGELGYAVVDINSDGIPELLLGTKDKLVDSSPDSIFTLRDGEPVLLQSFWGRSCGAVSADGTIYNVGSGSAWHAYLSSYKLYENADALTQLTAINSDYSNLDEKPYYFQIVDGRNHYISEDGFRRFLETYLDPPEKMKLTFIPISNG